MFKVVLWDYAGDSAQFVETFLKKDGVEIIRTLHPDDPDQAEVIMRGDWNFVLIFENGQRELFNEIFKTMKAMNVSTENIVFAKDFFDMLKNPAAVYALMKPEVCDKIYRHWNFFNQSRWYHYNSISAEGFHYVATSNDYSIMKIMYTAGRIYPSNSMKIFHTLSKKYYGVDDSAGYFLDLGANIGTTGIYFCKKFAPNLKCIAFEPDAENFKLLRINTILNDAEDKMTLVNCGLGEKFDEMTMYRNLYNPGASSVFQYMENMPPETVKIIPIDAYLAENKIAPQEIKYIWIDTEGFEAQVLLGAKNLLTKNPAPVFMECNPKAWEKSGKLDQMVELIKEVGYTHYIWIQEQMNSGKENLHPIEQLLVVPESPDSPFGQIGDIFLI